MFIYEKDNLSFPQLIGNGAMKIYRPVQQSERAYYFFNPVLGFSCLTIYGSRLLAFNNGILLSV